MLKPAAELLEGASILEAILGLHGFRFKELEWGRGSGGEFSSGEFTRDAYRLSFSVRHGLGLVEYGYEDQAISHEDYLRFSGAWGFHQFPGFGGSVRSDFEALAADLATHVRPFVLGRREEFLAVVASRDANPNKFKGFRAISSR